MYHTRSAALFVMVIGLLGGALAHGAGPDKSSSAAHEKRAQTQPQAELPATGRSDSSSPSAAAAAQPADQSNKSATESAVTSTATSVAVSTDASTPTSVEVASSDSTATAAVVASNAPGAGKARTERPPVGDALEASVLSDSVLAEQRGGTETHNQNNVAGTVTDNVASQLTTGSNSISENSFSNSSGIPIVIQNSGNNVLIQNSTILNLQLASPAK
jgi:Tfp pilus assembly protein PilV